VIQAIADTKAVDLWILFPYGAINRMLVSDALPPKAWADRLTRIFGTDEWKKDFCSTSSWQSLIDPEKRVERTYKTADQERITEFFMKRLLLFVLMFAAGNEKGANAGVKIANDLMKGLGQ
jgi:three-Cys-motif partner protein